MSPTSLGEARGKANYGGLAAFAGPDLTSHGRNHSAATYLNAGSLEFQAMLRNSSIVPIKPSISWGKALDRKVLHAKPPLSGPTSKPSSPKCYQDGMAARPA